MSVLVIPLCGSGCQQDSKQGQTIAEPPEVPPSRTLTLSDEQLVFLDWRGENPAGARVTEKRMIAGPGVEFDIYFPSNAPGSRSMDFVSSGEGGRGALIGADVRGYESFALNFTLVSINNSTEPELRRKLAVGAVIGPTATGQLSAWEPATLSLSPEEKTVTAKTLMRTERIYQIGFRVRMLNPGGWDSSGTMVTILVRPVEHAGFVPTPGR
jgi:hypothetical protein